MLHYIITVNTSVAFHYIFFLIVTVIILISIIFNSMLFQLSSYSIISCLCSSVCGTADLYICLLMPFHNYITKHYT